MRRVELTHDVLCGVVKASRDLRHERESREATEKMLAEQRERAAAARHALVRARQVAAVCIVLAVGAVAAAIFAYFSSQRAKRAEDLAQQSRVQAETLLGYLTAGFARELENSGRLDVIASLAKREIDYFHGLPADLKGPETQRTAAQALVQFARASRRLGDLDAAWDAASEAVAILEAQRKGGDESEATIIALARALDVQALILSGRQDAKATPVSSRAAEVIGALSKRPDAPAAVRETESRGPGDAGIPADRRQRPESRCHAEKSRAAGDRARGARRQGHVRVRALHRCRCLARRRALLIEGKYDEARSIAEDASNVADGILTLNPGDRTALYALALMQQSLGDASASELRPQEAIPPYLRAAAVQQTLVDFDPKNTVAQNNLASVQWTTSEAYWAMGQVDDALEMLDSARATLRISGEAGHLVAPGAVSLPVALCLAQCRRRQFRQGSRDHRGNGLARACAEEERARRKPRGPLCRTAGAPGGVAARPGARRRERGPRHRRGHGCAAPGDAAGERVGHPVEGRLHVFRE